MDLNLHVQGRIGGGTVIVARGDLDYGAADRFRLCVERALQPLRACSTSTCGW